MFVETSPEAEMVEDNAACDCDVKRGCLVSVLRYIDKLIANIDLVLVKTLPLVPEHEHSISFEWL